MSLSRGLQRNRLRTFLVNYLVPADMAPNGVNGVDRHTKPIDSVIIVGAGPSGLILALLLARSPNPPSKITLLDAAPALDKNPRAAHYAPSACYELDRAGVLGDISERGFFPEGVCWRKPDGTLLGGIHNDEVKIQYPMVCLPLDRLDELLLEHLLRDGETWKQSGKGNIEVHFNHRIVGLDQSADQAKVEVEIGAWGETKRKEWFSADYVIGADGANSGVRRLLFGDKNYPGETLQHQIIATNVYYDFKKFDYWDSNFIVDPENWYMAAKITTDGVWRVTYGDVYGLTNEEYIERQPMRFEKILPGNPKPDEYKLVSKSPYKLQQRCAPSMRVGRFLLVADAAHLCNPFGGMGLTGGIADVGSLFDALVAMQVGRADDKILDEYSRCRIEKWKDFINPTSR